MTTFNAMLVSPSADANSFAARLGDRYLRFLGIVLVGYAIAGKGFAYLGIPPLFIGEIALLSGVAVAMTASYRTAIRSLSVAWPLLLFMAWGACRTFPFIGEYGMDALRDGVTWGYGAFALIIILLIAERNSRLLDLIAMYRKMIPILLILGIIVSALSRRYDKNLPHWPWADVPIIHIKGGDFLVHVTGAFAFLAIIGIGRTGFLSRAWWLGPFFIPLSLGMNMAGRAGVLSFGVGAGLVAFFRPYSSLAVRLSLICIFGLFVLWASDFKIELEEESPRNISFEQLRDNFMSIVSDSDRSELSGSKGWRLEWWTDIVNYTFNGPYFWTGKGYGINLANADGYQVTEEESLRSPHNGHMTQLARGGVPGLALWILVQSFWIVSVTRAYVSSRRKHQSEWAAWFAFLIVYWAAFMANTAFDVFIEGPMGGIWLWVLFGVGLASIETRRTNPNLFNGAGIFNSPGRSPSVARATSNLLPASMIRQLENDNAEATR